VKALKRRFSPVFTFRGEREDALFSSWREEGEGPRVRGKGAPSFPVVNGGGSLEAGFFWRVAGAVAAWLAGLLVGTVSVPDAAGVFFLGRGTGAPGCTTLG